MNLRHVISSASFAVALGVASIAPAQASPISVGQSVTYSLNVLNTSGTTSATPYATVQLTQGNGKVDVTVTPSSGYAFSDSNGPHYDFAFNLLTGFNDATVALTGSNAADFQIMTGGPFTQTPFGDFGHAIDFSSLIPGGGLSQQYTKSLTFSVTKASLVVDDFIKNTNGYLFASDLGNLASGATQNVASIGGDGSGSGNGGQVPEPASLALVGTGLLIAALRRRKS